MEGISLAVHSFRLSEGLGANGVNEGTDRSHKGLPSSREVGRCSPMRSGGFTADVGVQPGRSLRLLVRPFHQRVCVRYLRSLWRTAAAAATTNSGFHP